MQVCQDILPHQRARHKSYLSISLSLINPLSSFTGIAVRPRFTSKRGCPSSIRLQYTGVHSLGLIQGMRNTARNASSPSRDVWSFIPFASGPGDQRRYLITFEATTKTRLRIESANHRHKADKHVA